MALNKIIGYILSVFGIAALLLSFDAVQKASGLTMPSSLSNTVLTIIGLVLLGIGMFLIVKTGGSGKVKEVPIYHGKEIVGYRRINE